MSASVAKVAVKQTGKVKERRGKFAVTRTLKEISEFAHRNKISKMRLAGCSGSPVNLGMLSLFEHGFELFLTHVLLEVASHQVETLLPRQCCRLHVSIKIFVPNELQTEFDVGVSEPTRKLRLFSVWLGGWRYSHMQTKNLAGYLVYLVELLIVIGSMRLTKLWIVNTSAASYQATIFQYL